MWLHITCWIDKLFTNPPRKFGALPAAYSLQQTIGMLKKILLGAKLNEYTHKISQNQLLHQI
uniref:Putative ovule protein n=1 Tax=Solanum chacoense TaxID=4108 RepID=A0A0V0HK69_SOLCH